MTSPTFRQLCTCPCGASQIVVNAAPRARYFCHCTICQVVCKQNYADCTALRAEEVTLMEGHKIEFKKYGPSNGISRGNCSICGSPVVDFLNMLPGIRAAFVPGEIYPDQTTLPPPTMHLYYHRRATDISDPLPKHSGAFRSQLAAAPMMLISMLRRPSWQKQDEPARDEI